ncbi:MAG: 5-methyltetrahydropteroyltriglutamate--homocysteine S-methyltransferase [Hyphomonadaceae bacterium]|nr:5-methyltetrahydropteroyltriglutamate--homocysteine S-methyltransferase [Hyphomonadaceae bacterium]
MSKSGPFRADHVGSLLRPAALLEARAKHNGGELDANALTALEDAAIRRVVERQEEVGLHGVTDGEFRRESWVLDFISHLGGVNIVQAPAPPAAPGEKPGAIRKYAKVAGRVHFAGHPMIEHFRFLKSVTRQTAKLTIPAPTMLVSASRDWRGMVEAQAYTDVEALLEDLGEAYKAFVRAAYDAGCRYLQLDDVNMSYLCDADMREKIKARGDDPEALLAGWIKTLNSVLASRPADMTMTTHVCRGNFRSAWFASGGYEPIADAIFNQLDYDGYFLEYDSERAGGFEPLRFLPKGKKRVVLGLMTTKTGELEPRDLIKTRVEAASKFADASQLCLSPQCGFASHEDGNLLSDEAQWTKLRQVVELAKEIWPDA